MFFIDNRKTGLIQHKEFVLKLKTYFSYSLRTGLAAKNETTETTIENLFCPFSLIQGS